MSLIGEAKGALDTPALWVDLDRLEDNIATLAAYFADAGVHWRPHMKGVKVPAIAHMALGAGAIGVTCAKLSEAEVMAHAGIRDILIANQVVGARKTARLARLRRRVDAKVAVDSRANVVELGRAAQRAGVTLGVLVDVNTGMNRTGVSTVAAAVALAKAVQHQPGLHFRGLMAWEGHTVAMEDEAAKREAITAAVATLGEAVARCRAAGLAVELVSGGGSGTYKVTPFLPEITEIQAGGAIFSDVTYEQWGVTTEPAIYVRATVTSRPAPARVIVDAGFKALPSHYAWPRPLGVGGVRHFSSSAEHGVLTLDAPDPSIRVGDEIDFVVGYTDATLFLHDQLVGVRDGVVEVVWDIVGRGKLT